MAKLLTDPVAGGAERRAIGAFLREALTWLEFRNTVTAASPDPYTNWKIAAPAYVVVAGDVLRYDQWIHPLNPGTGAGAMDLIITTAPGSASAAGVVDSGGANIVAGGTLTGGWVTRTLDLTPIVGKTISDALLLNAGDGLGEHLCRYRDIRITDAAGTTLRVTIWASGDPAFNVDYASQSNTNQSAIAFDAPGWLGDPAHASIAFATDEALRDGVWHKPGLTVFPTVADSSINDDGIQTGGNFRATIACVVRELAPALEFRGRYQHSTNPYSYWRILAPSYTIVSGDVLRYEVWVDPKNPGAGAGSIEIDFTTGSPANGRSAALVDQNGTSLVAQPVGSVGQWMSRTISLTAVAGKVINSVDLVSEIEGAVAGSYRAIYRNIRITDAPGTTLKLAIWSEGAPAASVSAYSQGASQEQTSVYDAPLTTDLSFNDFAQILCNPKALIGKTFDLTLVSQATTNGNATREIVDARRCRAVRAAIRGNVVDIEFADVEATALSKVYPAATFTIADFPELFEDHVGRPVADGVGQLVRVPLVWLKKTGGTWRHGICQKRAGMTYTVGAIYRGESEGQVGRVVPPAEYTVGNLVGAATGIDVLDVSFVREQVTANGQPYALSADVLINSGSGATEARQAANEIRRLLLLHGLTVDAASFDAAASYGVTHKMFADAGYTKPLTLRAILTDLLGIARAMLGKSSAGRITLLQDKTGTSAATFYEDSDAIEVGDVEFTDSPAKVSLYYRPAKSGTEDWQATPITRTPGGALPERRYQNRFVRDHETADRLTDYLAKRDSVGMACRAAIHAVQFDPRELLTIVGATAWRGAKTWRIAEVSRPADRNDLSLMLYDPAIHTYTAGTLPAGATNVYTPDYSQTPPTAPTSASVTSNVTAEDESGVALCTIRVVCSPPSPSVNWDKLYARVVNNVTGEVTAAHLMGFVVSNYRVSIGRLQPNTSHTVLLYAVNANGVEGATTSVAVTTAAFTGAPPTPTGQNGAQQAGDTLEFWVDNPPSGRQYTVAWEVKVGAGSFTAVAGNGSRITVPNITYGTNYQARAKYKDAAGNVSSSYSTAVSLTPSKLISDSHITALGVGNASVATAAITQTKISKSVQSVSASVGAGAYASFGGNEYMIDTRFHADPADAPSLQLFAGELGGSPYRFDAVGVKNISGSAKTFTMDYLQVIL